MVIALKTQTYQHVGPVTREALIRLFNNRGWELPEALGGKSTQEATPPAEALTLWKGIELTLKHPEIANSTNRRRMEDALAHVLKHFGKGYLLADLWIPELKTFFQKRLAEGASAGTVNKEKAALSRIFGVLIEHQLVDRNPCRLVPNLSEKTGQREAYIGHADFMGIVQNLNPWARPIMQCLYFSGLRRGEAVNLTRDRVDLSRRLMFFGPSDTKERSRKRVPIAAPLMDVLRECLRVPALKTNHVFTIDGRPIAEDSLRPAFIRACKAHGMDPVPTVHDLRHCWIANARRSGVAHEIIQTVVGHWNRMKSVGERYGAISDEELVEAIDKVTWDHGVTELWLNRKGDTRALG